MTLGRNWHLGDKSFSITLSSLISVTLHVNLTCPSRESNQKRPCITGLISFAKTFKFEMTIPSRSTWLLNFSKKSLDILNYR